MSNISGIGLYVLGRNSGPFTNLMISGTGTCAEISSTTPQTNQTRGIHGLTCNATGSSGSATAIYVDAPNNTLEDIYISGSTATGGESYSDGILIGSQHGAQGNTIINVTGGSNVGKLVHISSYADTSYPSNCPVASGNPLDVCHVTIVAATKGSSTTTIYDELNGNTNVTSPTVAMYVVGEQVFSGTGSGSNIGYTRFTTSPGIQAWLTGSSNPSGSCATGTIYSCTGSCTNGTFQACVNGSTPWATIPTH
jgi:hypothetical protein